VTLEAAIEARVSEILEALRLATGDAWQVPVRVKVTVQAKLRPRVCGVSECGWTIPSCSGPLAISLAVYLPTGVVLDVTEDREATRLRTRGG
jgi:hypothetical protein